MKRFSVLIAMFALAVPTLVAQKSLDRGVQGALLTALSNEREAAAGYEASALKADEEGYKGAAALFRAVASAERIHESRFVAALKEGGVEIPPSSATHPAIGSTPENLRAAARDEQKERDGMYRTAYETAQQARDSAVAKLFDVTRDAETEHGNLFSYAASNLEKMKEHREYQVCRHCGYVTDVQLPLCPSCRDQHALEPVD